MMRLMPLQAEMLAQITHTVQDTASSINTLAHGLCLAPEKENEGGIERRQRSSEKEGTNSLYNRFWHRCMEVHVKKCA